MDQGLYLSFAALGLAVVLYVAGIYYAYRGDLPKSSMLIIAGAALTLAGMV